MPDDPKQTGDDGVFRSEFGMTRRQLLRRGAVVGGTLMWTAPMIRSLTPAAFGQQRMGPSPGSHACCHCSDHPGYDPATDTPQELRDRCIHADGFVESGFSRDECQNACRDRGYQTYQYQTSTGGCTCTFDTGCACTGTILTDVTGAT